MNTIVILSPSPIPPDTLLLYFLLLSSHSYMYSPGEFKEGRCIEEVGRGFRVRRGRGEEGEAIMVDILILPDV